MTNFTISDLTPAERVLWDKWENARKVISEAFQALVKAGPTFGDLAAIDIAHAITALSAEATRLRSALEQARKDAERWRNSHSIALHEEVAAKQARDNAESVAEQARAERDEEWAAHHRIGKTADELMAALEESEAHAIEEGERRAKAEAALESRTRELAEAREALKRGLERHIGEPDKWERREGREAAPCGCENCEDFRRALAAGSEEGGHGR
jgi:chromosome segregation ATPase